MSVSCSSVPFPLPRSPLSQKERLKLDTTTPFVPNYVKSNLTSSANPAQTYASRVQGRQILLENPARESRAKKERQQNRAARRAAGPGPGASSKSSERRKRGAWKLRKEETKYGIPVAYAPAPARAC